MKLIFEYEEEKITGHVPDADDFDNGSGSGNGSMIIMIMVVVSGLLKKTVSIRKIGQSERYKETQRGQGLVK